MRDIKIRIRSEEYSEIVQKLLFVLGCEWYTCGKMVTYEEKPFLFTYNDRIVYGGIEEYFNRNKNFEVDLDWLADLTEKLTWEK